MKVSETHNQSSMSSSCHYRSVVEKPPLRQIFAEGRRIDKLYLRKFIPLREKTIVTTRERYDYLRNEKLQAEASSKLVSEKVLTTLKKKHKRRNLETKEIDPNSVIGLVMLKTKNEMSQSKKSINICTCCSCTSSIIAREAGTRYIRDNITGKKVYKISRSNKKKELRTVRSLKPKLIRSEPTTNSTLSSLVDRIVKVKSSIYSLYRRQCQSENEGLQYNISKNSLEYNYGTMVGDLQNVSAENMLKPNLTAKNIIVSVGDNLDMIKNEIEPDQTKSFLIKNKRATVRTLKSYFCTLKLLKKFNVNSKIFKWGLKGLPKIMFDFPKFTYSKKIIQLKPKIIQHKPLPTKWQFKEKNNTISKESINPRCSVKRQIISSDHFKHTLPQSKTCISAKIGVSNINLYIDTIEKIIRGKTINYPRRETIFCSTMCLNAISEKPSRTPTRSRSLVELPRNYTINNKHTTEPQFPIQNLTINSINFTINNRNKRKKTTRILTLHNWFGSSCLDKYRRKFFKSTMNRCFCKLVHSGKDKSKEKSATDSVVKTFCEITGSVKNKQQDAGKNSKYKYFLKVLGSYKRKEKSPNPITSLMPESNSSKSHDPTIEYKIRTKVHTVKRQRNQLHSIISLKSKCYRMPKNSHSSIVRYEWKPTITVNNFQTNITKKSVEHEAVNLRRYSCRLLKKKDASLTQLYIIDTADTGNIINLMVSPPTPYLFHSQSMIDFQYFEQFSPNPLSLGVFSHREDSIWHQKLSLRDPLKKYASVRVRFSNSCTDFVSYCACLRQCCPKRICISRRQFKKSSMNNLLAKKNESAIESDLKSTRLSYQHLQQFYVMNLDIVDRKMEQEKLKLFDREQGACVQSKGLNFVDERLNRRTRSSIITSTSVSQLKQKRVNPCYRQTNICTLTPLPKVKKKCIHCEQGRVQTYVQMSRSTEPRQHKRKNSHEINHRKKSVNKNGPLFRSKRSSFATMTMSGLISVRKNRSRIMFTQKSTCTSQNLTSKIVAAATATTKKIYAQKGTDSLYANHDLRCEPKYIYNQKQATPKQYPRNGKLVDYVPAFETKATAIGFHGTKPKSPKKIEGPPTTFERCTRKLKSYQSGCIGTKRDRSVGTKRCQTKLASRATEACPAKNVRFSVIPPKDSKSQKPSKKQTESGKSSYCLSVVFSTEKLDKQKSFRKRGAKFDRQVAAPCSATSLKRCFCTTSLKNSERQVFYVPIITRRNKISDDQRKCWGVSLFHNGDTDLKLINRSLCYAPYIFSTIDYNASECIEPVVNRMPSKKINLSIENTDIINSAQFKIGTCTKLLTSNIDILSSDKINKELSHKKSYTRSSGSTQDVSLLGENIGVVKSSTNLQSDTTQESSIGKMCNTNNLTGMTQHLNRHIYALRLETAQMDNKRCEVKIILGGKGKNCRSQTKFDLPVCKTSVCALDSFNSKVNEKKPKQRKLSPGECRPDDCALGNYNPKKCEQKILARSLSPTACDPKDCALGNFKPKKCEKMIKAKARNPDCKSGECAVGNNKLKKNEKKSPEKNNQHQATESQRNAEKAETKTEKFERKTTPLSHIVEERRFKTFKYPFDTGISITSSVSLDIEIYKQPKAPKLKKKKKDKTCKSVCKNTEKVSIQHKNKPSTNRKPEVPGKSKPKKTKNVSKLISTTPTRSVCIQAKPQQRKNLFKKCVCTFLGMKNTKHNKFDANASVGVITKDKYLEPELFYPSNKNQKPIKGTRTFSCGTAIPKKSLSTMTDKKIYDNQKRVVAETSNLKTHVQEKVKPRKHEAREKPSTELGQDDKHKMRIPYSDINIISNVSFDVEISKYETGEKKKPSSKSAPKSPKPVLDAGTPKDKSHSHKIATNRNKNKIEKVANKALETKKKQTSSGHPSLKRCFCSIKLIKPPYTQTQIVNFMTSTITPLNNLKRRAFGEKKSNSYTNNTHLFHDTINRSRNDALCRDLNSSLNAFTNKFDDVVLTKLFRKSLDVIHTFSKKKNIQVVAPFRGNRRLCDNSQTTFSNKMKIIYPYNSNKFHNYTSCTMIHESKKSGFRPHSRRHYLHYDLITKKPGHKRQCITQKFQKDFNKRPYEKNHFLNKLKNTFISIFTLFYGKKHKDVCSRGNNKPNKHSEVIKKKTTKVDILKTSKSDRQKCHVVNNVDPLKTCKSDRQPVYPKLIINQQKSKRVKVVSPKVSINDTNNTRHSKCTEQGIKIYSRFQSGDIEICQSRRKDYVPKYCKHYLNDYQSLKFTEYDPNLHKQKKQLSLKQGKKKEKYEGACEGLEWVNDKRLKNTRKTKTGKSKNDTKIYYVYRKP